jgi:hypothetical protein
MSTPVTPAAVGLPVVDQALEPTWVRKGSTATKQDYTTALAFEKVLVEQLTKSMAATSGLGGEGGEEEGQSPPEGGESGGAGAGTSQLSTLLPQALSAGIAGAGGLGLASQLTRDLQGTQPGGSISRSGGTAA